MKRRSSPSVDGTMAARIKAMLKRGYHQHQIAAYFCINQGRVSEIKTGKTHASIPPARECQLDLEI
jgi:predicted XRE-type DNA-binding protein